jgi:Glycosyltransferase family 87
MSTHDGPWTPRNPGRVRAVAVAGLVVVGIILMVGARTARNGGLTGDFPIYYRAAAASAAGQTLENAAAQGYLAPPLCAAVMAPLAHLSQGAAAIVWVGVTFALFAAMLWLGSRNTASRWCLTPGPLCPTVIALGAALLSFGQLRAELRNGQVDGLLVAAFVFGLVALDRRDWLAGLAIGFGTNSKYTSIILLPYLIARRRFGAAAWTAVFTIAFAFLPALVTGWKTNLTNLSISLAGVLRLIGVDTGAPAAAAPPLEYSRSVSLTSAVSRVALDTIGHEGMYGLVLLVGLALLGACWAMYRRLGAPLWFRARPETRDEPAVTSLEWCAALTVVLLFSPQTQVRHMVALILPHMVAVALILRNPRRSGWLIAGLIALQAGLHLPPGSLVSKETSDAWRAAGWPSWCLAAFLLTLVWTGLRECRAIREESPPGCSAPA